MCGERINGTTLRRPLVRRVVIPRGTGFDGASPIITSQLNSPDTVAKRRWIVRDDNPDSPSDKRMMFARSGRGSRCAAMNANTS
jgi:hypothetical protein